MWSSKEAYILNFCALSGILLKYSPMKISHFLLTIFSKTFVKRKQPKQFTEQLMILSMLAKIPSSEAPSIKPSNKFKMSIKATTVMKTRC